MALNISQVNQAQALVAQLTKLVATYKAANLNAVPSLLIDVPDPTGVHHQVTISTASISTMLQSEASAIVAQLTAAGIDTTGWQSLA